LDEGVAVVVLAQGRKRSVAIVEKREAQRDDYMTPIFIVPRGLDSQVN
jgi:hypothetical protein